jgi:predicted RNA-binding Zn ribbon-like protein
MELYVGATVGDMRRKPLRYSDLAAWRNGFLFIANNPALDLVNTSLIVKGEELELIPDFAALVRWFRAAGLIGAQNARHLEQHWARSSRASKVAASVRDLRAILRQEAVRQEQGRLLRDETLATLNRLLASRPMRTRLRRGRSAPRLEAYWVPNVPEDLLAPLADVAARLFAELPRDRVRKCARCVAHFYDNSKKGNRRWCSMQMCGNRQKVAVYAARHQALH